MKIINEPDPSVDMLAKLLTLYDMNPVAFTISDGAAILKMSEEKNDNTFTDQEKLLLRKLWDEYATEPL